MQLAGPTNFSPLVQRVVNNIKSENNPLKYHILLILTDGVIYDKQETIDALVEKMEEEIYLRKIINIIMMVDGKMIKNME